MQNFNDRCFIIIDSGFLLWEVSKIDYYQTFNQNILQDFEFIFYILCILKYTYQAIFVKNHSYFLNFYNLRISCHIPMLKLHNHYFIYQASLIDYSSIFTNCYKLINSLSNHPLVFNSISQLHSIHWLINHCFITIP